ncbi:hypothetical protein SAMN05216524_107383 [Mucilaginibacter sp. OK098]|nr:hypothetical protein SAMN05216524_107383 [Mucilaginibacter sp. OK098]
MVHRGKSRKEIRHSSLPSSTKSNARFSLRISQAFQARKILNQPVSAPRAEPVIIFVCARSFIIKAPFGFIQRLASRFGIVKANRFSCLARLRCRKTLRHRQRVHCPGTLPNPLNAHCRRWLVSRHSIQSLRSLCLDVLLRSRQLRFSPLSIGGSQKTIAYE